MDRDYRNRVISNARKFAAEMKDKVGDDDEPSIENESYFLKGVDLSTHEFQNADFINWKRARALIEHENMLVNSRLTWLVATQATLFSAFGLLFSVLLSEKSLNNAAVAVPMMFISLLGIALSFNVFRSLRNADIQITEVTEWWSEYNNGNSDKASDNHVKKWRDHPPLHYWWSISKQEFWIKFSDITLKKAIHALWRTESLPVYFLCFWILLLLAETIYIFFNPFWVYLMKSITPNTATNVGFFMSFSI